MKVGIHPNWSDEAKIVCACGANFTTGSTLTDIHVDICSSCHPFFTGQSKFVDTLGQVERFQKKVADSKQKIEQRKIIEQNRAAKAVEKHKERLSLKELLMKARKTTVS
jgi:large subunit ribosomal protein L31